MEDSEISTANKRKSSKTSVACAACKSRKTKCSGGPPPCASCQRLNTKCVIHPGSDMRRRDSKDHFKAYKALLDAFVASTRGGDTALSSSLYRTIQITDESGKLAEIAQSYAQAVKYDAGMEARDPSAEFEYKYGKVKLSLPYTSPQGTDQEALVDAISSISSLHTSPTEGSEHGGVSISPILRQRPNHTLVRTNTIRQIDAACQTDPHRSEHIMAGAHLALLDANTLAVEDRPVASFDELTALWSNLPEGDISLSHLLNQSALWQARDPALVQTVDSCHLSQAVIAFRDSARRALQNGADLEGIIGTATPRLDVYFNKDSIAPKHSIWNWACQFAATFGLTVPNQLATIYFVGIQMRFFALPCVETFSDLPTMLRPMRKQYLVPHAAGVDICHVPVIKNFMLHNWAEHKSFPDKLIQFQSCNWQYSDAACFAPNQESSGSATMAQAFIEHISRPSSYTVEWELLKLVPHLTCTTGT